MNDSIRVLLADDHEIVRAGVRELLERLGGIQVVAEAENGRSAVALAAHHQPDVIVMDINMPGLNGLEAARQILGKGPARVVILSVQTDGATVTEALKAGVCGYVPKSGVVGELEAAIRAAAAGQTYISPQVAGVVAASLRNPHEGNGLSLLTPREREVLQLLAEGQTSKAMAAQLGISTKTAETHRAQLMQKLGIRSVAGLTKFAIRHGVTSIDQ